MLKFRVITILFFLIAAGLAIAMFTVSLHPVYLLALIFIYFSIIFYGAAFIQSGLFLNAICSADRQDKKISITFDDGPDKEITPAVLAVLKEKNIKATFFIIGKNIEPNKELIKKMDDEGHLIGNHSFSHHYWFDLFSSGKMTNEIIQTNELIFQTIHKKPSMFRPPYGVTNPNVYRAVKHTGLKTIGWSIRTFDKQDKPVDETLKKITSKIKSGDIILFHDTHQKIIPLLTKVIEFANKNNFEIIPLDQLLKIKTYE